MKKTLIIISGIIMLFYGCAHVSENKEAKELPVKNEAEQRSMNAGIILEEALADYGAGKENDAKEKISKARKMDSEISGKIEEEYIKKTEQLIEDNKYKEARKTINKVIFLNPDNKNAVELVKKLKSIMEALDW